MIMDSPIEFDILPSQKRLIREALLEPNMKKKYRSSADFVKSSIEILLAWESGHPEECMDILKTLKPFSSEQELFMKQSMKPEEIVKHFGSLDLDLHGEEEAGQKELAQTDFDHMKVIGNYLKSEWSYVKKIETLKPENVINYDGFPLLSINYNRFLPIKFTMLMMAHMLQSKKESNIELKELRVNAYDYIEEY